MPESLANFNNPDISYETANNSFIESVFKGICGKTNEKQRLYLEEIFLQESAKTVEYIPVTKLRNIRKLAQPVIKDDDNDGRLNSIRLHRGVNRSLTKRFQEEKRIQLKEQIFSILAETRFDTGLSRRQIYKGQDFELEAEACTIFSSSNLINFLRSLIPKGGLDFEDQALSNLSLLQIDVACLKKMNWADFGDFGLNYITAVTDSAFNQSIQDFKILQPDCTNFENNTFLARFGGDEFTVAVNLEQPYREEFLDLLQKKLKSEINQIPIIIKDGPGNDAELKIRPADVTFKESSPPSEANPEDLNRVNSFIKETGLGTKITSEKLLTDAKKIFQYSILADGQVLNLEKILDILQHWYNLPSNSDQTLEAFLEDFKKRSHFLNQIYNHQELSADEFRSERDKIISKNPIFQAFFDLAEKTDRINGVDRNNTDRHFWQKVMLSELTKSLTDPVIGDNVLNRGTLFSLIENNYFSEIVAVEAKTKGINDYSYFAGNVKIQAIKESFLLHIFKQPSIPSDLEKYVCLAKAGPIIFLCINKTIETAPDEIKNKVKICITKAKDFKGVEYTKSGEKVHFPLAVSSQDLSTAQNPMELLNDLYNNIDNLWYDNTIEYFLTQSDEYINTLESNCLTDNSIAGGFEIECWNLLFRSSRGEHYCFEILKKITSLQKPKTENPRLNKLMNVFTKIQDKIAATKFESDTGSILNSQDPESNFVTSFASIENVRAYYLLKSNGSSNIVKYTTKNELVNN